MPAGTSAGMPLAALFLCQSLLLAPAHAQTHAGERFGEEFTKQESIYYGNDKQLLENYIVDRSLADYEYALPLDFGRSLANLGSEARWLDIGAGMGHAILDYYAPDYEPSHAYGWKPLGGKARAVAMSIEDRRTARWLDTSARLEPGKIRYLHDKRLGEYTVDEVGRFEVITDMVGGFSYTRDLSLFMEKVLSFLKVNGGFYTLLQDVRSELGTNMPAYKGSPFLTEIRDASGAEVKVCAWLKSISCVEVTCQLRTEWQPPLEAYGVRKVCDDVNVPRLEMVHFQAGTPPERGFVLKAGSPKDVATAPSR